MAPGVPQGAFPRVWAKAAGLSIRSPRESLAQAQVTKASSASRSGSFLVEREWLPHVHILDGKKLMGTTLEPSDQEHTWTLDPDFGFKSLLYHLLGA